MQIVNRIIYIELVVLNSAIAMGDVYPSKGTNRQMVHACGDGENMRVRVYRKTI